MHRARLALVLAGLLLAAPARAEGTDSELITEGIQLRREHKDAEALERFRRAYELSAAPKTRVQIALAEQALGDWIRAETDLMEALSHDDAWIAERAEALKGSLVEIRTHLAYLQIETNVPGAELWENGVLMGKVPAEPMRVKSGNVEVEIRAEGYHPARRSVSVPSQSLVKIVVDMAQVAGPAARPEPLPTRAAVAPTSSLQTTLAWVTLAAAGVSLTTGIVGHVVRDLNATNYNDASCWDSAKNGIEPCPSYINHIGTAEPIAIAGYVGAGVLGGTSAMLFLLQPKKSKPPTSLDLTVLPSAAGMTLHGTF